MQLCQYQGKHDKEIVRPKTKEENQTDDCNRSSRRARFDCKTDESGNQNRCIAEPRVASPELYHRDKMSYSYSGMRKGKKAHEVCHRRSYDNIAQSATTKPYLLMQVYRLSKVNNTMMLTILLLNALSLTNDKC